jgi:hypothetical protein
MRAIISRTTTSAILFAAAAAALGAFGATPASAQSGQSGDYVHHNFCLLTGPARECAYESMAQCLGSKRGNADFCEPNDAPINHAPRGRYQ